MYVQCRFHLHGNCTDSQIKLKGYFGKLNMRKSSYSAEQISKALSDARNGVVALDVCERQGISLSTFYAWKEKYEGMSESEVKTARSLEEESQRLKRQLNKELRDNQLLRSIWFEISESQQQCFKAP